MLHSSAAVAVFPEYPNSVIFPDAWSADMLLSTAVCLSVEVAGNGFNDVELWKLICEVPGV